jgi:hypothetical protein
MQSDDDDDVDLTLRLLSSNSSKRMSSKPSASASNKAVEVTRIPQAQGESTITSNDQIRRALVLHERAALADASVAADPDRYAPFLAEGLAKVLTAYGDAMRSAIKPKVD